MSTNPNDSVGDHIETGSNDDSLKLEDIELEDDDGIESRSATSSGGKKAKKAKKAKKTKKAKKSKKTKGGRSRRRKGGRSRRR